MTPGSHLENLLLALPTLRFAHNPGTPAYRFMQEVARQEIGALFEGTLAGAKPLPPFGELVFPYVSMGAVDSLDLFGLDELILFSFYRVNRGRYQRVLDIGANIGLHSLILGLLGYEVRSYEPDPTHFELLQANLQRNEVGTVLPINAAVSDAAGHLDFVRVLGNTTGSHLKGSKPNPYGELEEFKVATLPIQQLVGWADLIKLDAEGHEPQILAGISTEAWQSVDVLVEIGTPENAATVWEQLSPLGLNLFAQKRNWSPAESPADLPTSHREGSLFITSKAEMPWGN